MVLDQPLARQSLEGEPDQPELQVPLTSGVSERVAIKVALPVVVSRRQVFSDERRKQREGVSRTVTLDQFKSESYECKEFRKWCCSSY